MIVVEVVAIQRQPRLEAQRIARAETDRQPAEWRGRLEQRGPQPHRVAVGASELEAIFAGVAGARGEQADACDLAAAHAEAR